MQKVEKMVELITPALKYLKDIGLALDIFQTVHLEDDFKMLKGNLSGDDE